MTSQSNSLFVLDANVFITAHQRYYSFDLCPGFWECLIQRFYDRRLLSIDKVRAELLRTGDSEEPDELYKWTKAAPGELFVSSSEEPVEDVYRKLIVWVNSNTHFLPAAKLDFAKGADGWLVAYAQVHNAVVVTEEVLNLDRKNQVPIPNVCQQFNVQCMNTFEMLRELGVRFDLRPTQ